METKDNITLIEIFAGTPWQAGLLKSLLENAEIEAFLADEIIGTLSPWWTAPGGAGSVKVFISSQNIENAKVIVSEFENNLKADQ